MNEATIDALGQMLRLIDARFTAIEQRLADLEQRQRPELYQTHPRLTPVVPVPQAPPNVVYCNAGAPHGT